MWSCLCCQQLHPRGLHAQAVRFPLMAAQQLCEVGQHPLAASSPSLQVHAHRFLNTTRVLRYPRLRNSASLSARMCRHELVPLYG